MVNMSKTILAHHGVKGQNGALDDIRMKMEVLRRLEENCMIKILAKDQL